MASDGLDKVAGQVGSSGESDSEVDLEVKELGMRCRSIRVVGCACSRTLLITEGRFCQDDGSQKGCIKNFRGMEDEDKQEKASIKELLDKLISQELNSDWDTDNEKGVSEGKRIKKKGKKSGLYRKASNDVKMPQSWSHLHLKLEAESYIYPILPHQGRNSIQ